MPFLVRKVTAVFLHWGSGQDAVVVCSGTNVLDSKTRTSFLPVGGAELDFKNARGAQADIWDTVINFHAGDSLTIFGVTPADFTLTFSDNQGATGHTGLTLYAAAPGNPSVCVIFVGLTMDALNDGTVTEALETDRYSNLRTLFHGMREPEPRYITRPNKNVRRIVIPFGTTLTPRVLLGALRKMPTIDIARAVDKLIAELDIRDGDPDSELEDPDESEECSE